MSRSPARRPALDSPTLAARGPTVTTSDGFVRSTVSSTVINLVMLAIGTRAPASRDSSTSPVAPFSTTKERPVTCGGAASTGAASARAAAAKRRPFKRPGVYLTLIRCPMIRFVGSTPGFNASSCSTVVSNLIATSLSVSPARRR